MKKNLNKKGHADRWVAVSGGFDPLHIGHVRMFKEAKKLGDKLVVIINNDHWLRKKKGFVFMPQRSVPSSSERSRSSIRAVLTGRKEADADGSVCRALEKLKPTVFANGGDRAA